VVLYISVTTVKSIALPWKCIVLSNNVLLSTM